jgi:AcrR family transcriptional regulator
MAKYSGRKRRGARNAVRVGRPPQELAGEVDGRILDAASRVFLEHGFAGASIEQIASLARAGKPTIYTRFQSKEALFAATVTRSLAAAIERVEGRIPTGEKTDERLASVGATALHWALAGDMINLMRVAIAEARRFPVLANDVEKMVRERAAETVARSLAEAAQSSTLGKLPAFAPERLATTAQFFRDLVLLPIIIRALFGEKLKPLRAEIEPHAARSVAFFLAACGYGGGN